MEKADLKRIHVTQAALVCVIAGVRIVCRLESVSPHQNDCSDTETNNVDREDFDNIIRAINIHRATPEVRMRLMVLRPANKMRAIAVGMPTKTVYSLNQLKCNLLSLSCLCPGFSTMLVNLCRSDLQLDDLREDTKAFAMLEP